MKFELFEALKLYGMTYPESLETLTEKEFQIIIEIKKRRENDGNDGNSGKRCGYVDVLCF